MELMQQSLEGRGEDKRRRNYRAMQGAALGGLGVAATGALAHRNANDELSDLASEARNLDYRISELSNTPDLLDHERFDLDELKRARQNVAGQIDEVSRYKKMITPGRVLGAGAGAGLLLGGLAALRSEANRHRAKKMSKNPASVMAELEKTRRKRRVRAEAKTLARVQAARQGRKVQGNPLIRIDRADGGR